jgi:mono/diheme cytochrome c family protein
LTRVLTAALIALAVSAPARAQSGGSFDATVLPFLKAHCSTCHSAVRATAGLNLETLATAATLTEQRERWEAILQKLSSGEMPPKSAPHPSDADRAQVTAWLHAEFDRIDRTAVPDPGRVTARRLNRAEYNYTIHDLLGVDFRPADSFPQDDAGYGFDNNGDVLSLSITQMEKYLAAAEAVARTAVYGPQSVKPVTARYQPHGRRRPGDFDALFFNTRPYLSVTNYDESGLSMPNSFHVMHRFGVAGDYVIRATPDNGSRPPGSEPLQMALFIDGVQSGLVSIDGELEGRTQEFSVRVTAGEHWIAVGFPKQFEGLPVLYGAKNPSTRPVPDGRGGRAARGAGAAGAGRGGRGGAANANNNNNNNDDAASSAFFIPPGAPTGTRLARPDNMGIQSLEIGGPHNADARPSPESARRLLVCTQRDAGCLHRIVENLARRAYRRPVTRSEIAQVMAHPDRARARGDSFDEQVVIAVQAVLVSPSFLFRIERDQVQRTAAARAPDAYYLTDYELASRLSYFLWSSMPDDELTRAAADGTLRRPEILDAHVRRMLKDPKIGRFVENFGGQWLQFRALEAHRPDFYKFPLWDNYLRLSAEQETRLFFENLIREDGSILDFLEADYTFVNQYLAEFYGLEGVKGAEFRRVSLAGTPRRGVLGQASVLTSSSYPDRTSVVLRGKWILENLLNAPPPPAPPNVPNLEAAVVGEHATLRQRMEAHRANAVCASCHSKMDPLGFGLENFDAIGSWRDKEGPSAIDPSGTLPDGKTFKGPVELVGVLRSQSPAFVMGLSERMLTYALGRGVETSDRPALRKIAAGVASADHRFSSVVLQIVNSLPFQMRKADKGRI